MTSRLFYTCSAIAIAWLLGANHLRADSPVGPRITIEPERIDLGIIESLDPILTPVSITNTGDQMLCITPQDRPVSDMMTKHWLEPGESAEINLRFEPKGAGPFDESVSFQTNDPTREHFKITWIGEYRPKVSIALPINETMPPVLQFGIIPVRAKASAALVIKSHDPDFFIRDVTTGDPHVECEDIHHQPTPNDPIYKSQATLKFTINDTCPSGLANSTATITLHTRSDPSDPNSPHADQELSVLVTARIRGHITADIPFIRVPQAFPNEPFSEAIRLTSDNGPFKVTACTVIESTLPGMTARTEPIPGEDAVHLILEGTGGTALGMFRGYIELATDMPNENALRVQFHGFVREKPLPP